MKLTLSGAILRTLKTGWSPRAQCKRMVRSPRRSTPQWPATTTTTALGI
jgi:hypothetical protein